MLTGCSAQTAVLHDIRSLTKKVHVFEGHTDEVLHLAWSPHNDTIFASASSDRRINVWDLSLIGMEQTPDDQEDGPPELLFVHGGKSARILRWFIIQCLFFSTGHTSRPTDFCWAPGEGENWSAVSASEDNIVMVWQPTMRVWAGDEVKIDARELEDDAMEGIESTADDKEGEEGSGSGGSIKVKSEQSSTVSVSGDD
jgi:histone-binding protein RBBP4